MTKMKEIYLNEKKSALILAQVDTISGEVLGFAIDRIMELGANNIQLIPTITKKNRPGNIIIIDTDREMEEEIAQYLAKELKIYGYHRINTSHIFHRVTFVEKNIKLKIDGKEASFLCEIKILGDPSQPLSVDVEHDFLVDLQKTLNEKLNTFISLFELRSMIESRLRESGNEINIEL